MAIPEFKYQNVFHFSAGGELVKWFISGLLLSLMLLQRPAYVSLFGHTCGCPCCGCFRGVVGSPGIVAGAGRVGLMEINAAGLEDRTVW